MEGKEGKEGKETYTLENELILNQKQMEVTWKMIFLSIMCFFRFQPLIFLGVLIFLLRLGWNV